MTTNWNNRPENGWTPDTLPNKGSNNVTWESEANHMYEWLPDKATDDNIHNGGFSGETFFFLSFNIPILFSPRNVLRWKYR